MVRLSELVIAALPLRLGWPFVLGFPFSGIYLVLRRLTQGRYSDATYLASGRSVRPTRRFPLRPGVSSW